MAEQEKRDRYDELERETMLHSRYLMPQRRYTGSEDRLERSAYTLLSRIDAQGPMSLGELSEALRLDVSTLNRQTAAMTKAGYLERVPDPDGGMARKFRLTAVGADRLETDRRLNAAGLRKVLAEWSAEDVDAFTAFMRRFNTDIERLDGRPWPRD